MEKMPKRRKKKDNPYTLFIDGVLPKIMFVGANGNIYSVEISPEIYQLFDNFELEDLSEMNEYDRHISNIDIEELPYFLVNNKPISVEEEAINNILAEELKNRISELPEIQRRRLVLYFFYDMTLAEIAIIENCSPQAVKQSIDISIKKLYDLLNKKN